MTRRRLLMGAGALVVAGVARGSTGRRASFEASELSVELPMDPAHDGVRVAQLSDLHLGPSTPPERVRAAVAAVNRAKVDLVALTGDYLTYSKRSLPLISELLGGLEAPAFAVLGNHDHWVDAEGVTRALEHLGCEVLHTRSGTGAPVA